jgi:glycine cleavage system regulatory protein
VQTKILLTVMGNDRPGLTEALAAAVLGAGGNWHESYLSRLGGKFVGSALVELAPEGVERLRAQLKASVAADLRVEIVPADEDPDLGEAVELTLTGQDRPGIVHEVSQVLARLGANIVELETHTDPSAWSGSALFRARTRLTLPDGLSHDALQAALEALSGDLMVDFEPL